jgi:hypothetical protein
MGQAIPVRTDYTVGEVRQFAKRAKDSAQARRLLAIAAVLDGASREDAAKLGGMDPIRWRAFVRSRRNGRNTADAPTSSVELAEVANTVKPGLLVRYYRSTAGGAPGTLHREDALIEEIRQAYQGNVVSAHNLDVF